MMEKAMKKTALHLSREAAFVLLTVALAVLLPQILHGAGILLGVGGKLGQMLLPMYLPVLLLALYRGAVPAAVAGLLSPLVSFALTAMPQQTLLPYITLELIATGLFAGVIFKAKPPAVLRVLLVQLAAKAVRLIAFGVALYAANGTLQASALFAGVVTSVPGVVIQLLVLSYLIVKKEKCNV